MDFLTRQLRRSLVTESMTLRLLVSCCLSLLVFCSNNAEKGGEMQEKSLVRQPAVAGAFYPGSKSELQKQVNRFLQEVKKEPLTGRMIGIIVPHAGYTYSGRVAAHAFRQIEGEGFRTVVLIGPSHRSHFKGVAVYPKGEWTTPLGSLKIDESLAAELIEATDIIVANPTPHETEHSLEVQLPFLQTVDQDLRIVPLMMGPQTEEICRKLGKALADVVGKRSDVLLLTSTDLYHGYSYDECVSTDRLTLSYIEKLDADGLYGALSADRAQACGGGPITALLYAARQLGANNAKLLKYTNSGDVTGEKAGYVVGYSAWLITAPATDANSEENSLNEEEQKELLRIARKSIESKLSHRSMPVLKATAPPLSEKRGVFVTLHKDGGLRGCIGYIHPIKPLYQAVSEMAIEAAFGDPRFPPLSEDELSQISIEISVLTPLEKVRDPATIEVGKHGIYIRKDMNSGLLLPQVATEQGWSRETFLERTCYKAGLPKDAWKDAEIYIFSAQIFHEPGERSD